MDRQTLDLGGCTPAPLMSYLKGLGVFRLVAAQKDANARGFWRGGVFCLSSVLGRGQLTRFFLEDYEPSPLIAPWNRGSGFLHNKKAAEEALAFIKESASPRLAPYRQAIAVAEKSLESVNVEKNNIGEADKNRIVSELRRRLPDEAIPWLDAVLVLSSDDKGALQLRFPPLLGTGGNDGNADFSVNFMARLREILTDSRARGWLEDALFGSARTPSVRKTVGFFNPSAAGGANVDQGFEASPVVNPWDFVLMLEGALFFAGSVSRRYAAGSTRGYAAYPFTVNPSPVGYGSATWYEKRGKSSHGELWLPLWERPATAREISTLFSEGRARVGRRPVQDGLDFTRALASLGTSRGVSGFVRYGLAKRRGDAFVAIPFGFYRTRETTLDGIGLLDELDSWLISVERAMNSSKKETPHGPKSAFQSLREAMHRFAVQGGRRELQGIISALGAAELALSGAASLRGDGGFTVRPLTLSDPGWLLKSDDGTPEFRIAAAVASILPYGKKIGPFRAEIEPVALKRDLAFWEDDTRKTIPVGRSLTRLLASVIEHRCLERTRQELDRLPLSALRFATLNDIRLFLEARLDERKTLSLLLGLSLLNPSGFSSPLSRPPNGSPALPRDYVLLKTHFLPGTFSWNGEEVDMASETGLVPLLRANRVPDACRLAERRLRISGVGTLSYFGEDGIDGVRLLASLLIPVHTRSFENHALPLVLKKENRS